MTKLEKLRTAYETAREVYREADVNARYTGDTAAHHDSYDALSAFVATYVAYQAELKKQGEN